MDGLFDPQRLQEDALYLGVLTARGVKPLSRLEYPVGTQVLEALKGLGLTVAPLTRIAQDGTRVTHLILGTDPDLVEQYRADFDGTALVETPDVIRLEARYFGYPACCAEAFIRDPRAPNDLPPQEQALLFHRACPGCQETPRLVLLYKSALAQARRLNVAPDAVFSKP